MKYRIFNCIKAHLCGYFWLPCPICGNNFGGHEWELGNSLNISPTIGMGVCPDCHDEAKELNKKNFNV